MKNNLNVLTLISDRADNLQQVPKKVDVKMNKTKTQFITNLVVTSGIPLREQEIEQVSSYKNIDHEIRLSIDNQMIEF